jgi:non-ribosomal peptide synthetase-like protein
MAAQWLGIFVSYMLLTEEGSSLLVEFASLVAIYMVINVVTIGVAIAGKWIILGRTKPGIYPLWGVYYFRWWCVQRLNALAHMKWFQGTPLMRLYLTALGAKIGRDAVLSQIESGAFDLLTIGDNVSIGHKVVIANAEVVGNELIIGRVTIGDDVYVGTSCVIGNEVHIAQGAEIADLTALADRTSIGAWEKWDGSPAQCVGRVDPAHLPPQADAPPQRRRAQMLAYCLALLILPPISLIPIFPGFFLFDQLDDILSQYFNVSYLYYLPLLTWPAALVMVGVTVLLIAALRWTILPRVRAGTYSIFTWFYTRKWVIALATEVTLETLSSLYATVYMRNWYRLMGAKIGKDAEISTNLAGRYDITEIGEKCFIADEVTLGDEDIRRGYMTLSPVRTGARVFVGNDAVVPLGAHIPDGVLIGIKSKPPENHAMKPGDTWFGSPPIHLPTRQKIDGMAAHWTYEPSKARRLGRAIFEAFTLSLPSMLFITCGTLAVEVFTPSILSRDYLTFVPLFLAASVIIPLVMTCVVAGLKWVLMGRYKPVMKPMWSWWAMRTEAVAVMYWGLAGKVLLEHLRGTPFLPWILRLFGTKTGRGIYMDMTDITEFDCVTIGDFTTLNSLSALQTHLYEDRVMKVGRVHVGQGVMVGALSTVLYDTHIGDYARLRPLTVVMKGEALPAHTQWAGAPAVPASAHPAPIRAAA